MSRSLRRIKMICVPLPTPLPDIAGVSGARTRGAPDAGTVWDRGRSRASLARCHPAGSRLAPPAPRRHPRAPPGAGSHAGPRGRARAERGRGRGAGGAQPARPLPGFARLGGGCGGRRGAPRAPTCQRSPRPLPFHLPRPPFRNFRPPRRTGRRRTGPERCPQAPPAPPPLLGAPSPAGPRGCSEGSGPAPHSCPAAAAGPGAPRPPPARPPESPGSAQRSAPTARAAGTRGGGRARACR